MTGLPRAVVYSVDHGLAGAPAGTLADLTALGGHVRQAVAVGGPTAEARVRRLLDGHGLADLVEVVAVDGAAPAPPGGARLRATVDRLGLAAGDVLVVGGPDDRAAARRAGTAFAATDPVTGPGVAVRAHLAEGHGPFTAARWLVGPADGTAAAAARARQDALAKPPGSLGRIEDLGVRLAALARRCPPPPPAPAAVAVFAGDHGVVAQGVTVWPQEVTALMVDALAGRGAAVQVLARATGARVVVVDVGVVADLAPRPGLVRAKVRRATRDLATGPALTPGEVRAALDVGARVAGDLVAEGARVLVTGDMGIGNTTPSAAVISALARRDPASVVGRGAGADDATMARKLAAIRRGLARVTAPGDARHVLAEVGGLEIAALAGFVVGGASHRTPVVVDGVIALAGTLAAVALCPPALDAVVAGHRSTEPGAAAALAHLGLQPLLDLGLRLGEGTGAVLALPLLEAAAAVLSDMATLADVAP